MDKKTKDNVELVMSGYTDICRLVEKIKANLSVGNVYGVMAGLDNLQEKELRYRVTIVNSLLNANGIKN